MTEKDESPLERMKKQPLWFWGGLCIFSGMISNLVMRMMIDAQNLRGAEKRGALFGSGAMSAIFVLLGIVLIVMFFARKKRS